MLYILNVILLIINFCLSPLLFTILIEGTFAFAVTKQKKYILESIFCNIITNPVVNIVNFLIAVAGGSRQIHIVWSVIAEILVVFVEAYIYRRRTKLDKQKCFWLAYTANLFSLSLYYFFRGKDVQGLLPVMLYIIVAVAVSVYQKKNIKKENKK